MKRYPFANYILDIPDDHKIADIHAVDHLYDRAFGEFYRAIAKRSPRGTFLDIGANVGDTAAAILSVCSDNPVLCVEGSPEFVPYLQANLRHLGPRVSLINRYVRPPMVADIAVRTVHDRGSAHLMSCEAPGASLDNSAFVTLDDVLKQAHALGSEIALVKTDTDGFDGYIVSALVDDSDCPLFFECDLHMGLPEVESPWPNVFERLDAAGYAIVIFDNHGLPVLTAQEGVAQVLTDLCGYVCLQRAVQPVRMHYIDVWAFPPSWHDTFIELRDGLRREFLRPYRF